MTLDNVVNFQLLWNLVKKYQSVSVLYVGWCNTALMHRHDRAGRRRWLLRTAGVWQAPNPVGRGLEKARGKQNAIWLLSRFLPGMCLFKTSRPASCWAVVPKCPQAVLLQLKQVRFFFFSLCMCVYLVGGYVLGVNNYNLGRTLKQQQSLRQPKRCPLLQYHRHLPATFKPVRRAFRWLLQKPGFPMGNRLRLSNQL